MSRKIAIPKELEPAINKELTNISKIIKDQRINLNLTQQQLAEKLGCEVTTIQAYEQGRKSPSIKSLLMLLRILRLKLKIE